MLSDCMSDPLELARMWQAVLGKLQIDVITPTFDTWLRHTRALGFDGATLRVEAVRAFDVDHLNERLLTVVERAVHQACGEQFAVRFVAPNTAVPEPRPSSESAGAPILGAVNAAHTFDRYITTSGNQIAFQCAQAILGDDDLAISPVVIHGSPGMGKTHLLQALAQGAAHRGWTVACMSAEEFTTRYQSSLRRKSVEDFQDTLRKVRLLVIDDLQYLSGKRGTQDELVHTFDAITSAGGYVAIGSETHPSALDLPERLVSRLAAGISLEIGPFQSGERRALIERLGSERRVALPAWALDRIAQLQAPSVRALQGALNAALVLARGGMLDAASLDAALVRAALLDAAPACGDRLLLDAIARHFQATFDDLAGRSRKGQLGQARAVAVAALRERGRSLAEIATLLGGRDKSTISPLVERGRELLAGDEALRQVVTAA